MRICVSRKRRLFLVFMAAVLFIIPTQIGLLMIVKDTVAFYDEKNKRMERRKMRAAIYLGKENVEVRELEMPVCGEHAVVFGCGTIGIAAAVALKHFGMSKVMLCDLSDFRLNIAKELGFSVCNMNKEVFREKAMAYFGTAPSLKGVTADIDCFIDAAGAESVLDLFMELGKIESRFVCVAVNNSLRRVDLLHMTYAQKSIIGSGGYMPEDVRDVMEIFASGKLDLESIITHEFALEQIGDAIRTAADAERAFNVTIKF